jgi:dTDP-4-dehydrorhamnose 3,5-epimerase
MIDGVKRHPLKKFFDDRGFFMELLRDDWDIVLGDEVVQFNLSFSYPGIIRAWHRHLRGQNDYFICVRGSVKVCGFDDREKSTTNGDLSEIILSGDAPEVVRMPGDVWHGFKVVGNEPAYFVYGVNKLYDYDNPDEERKPWNSESIIPKSINGKTNDPRVGKPWDWNYSPHK